MPKPEKHVFVCTQSRPMGHPRSSCSEKKCAQVMEESLWQVQQRDLFHRFQVTATGCMGPCSEGPTIVVYPEGVMYGGVSKEEIYDYIGGAIKGKKGLKILTHYFN